MSGDVRVKEEPIDFECSPFELLNEIGQTDDVTTPNNDVTTPNNDVTGRNNDVTSCNDDVTSHNNDVTSCNDDVTSHNNDVTSRNDDFTSCIDDVKSELTGDHSEPVIKQEYEVVVKTEITVGAEDDEHCSVLHPTPRDFSESRARPTRSRDLSTEQTGLFADPDRTPAPLDSVEDVERDEHGDQTDGFSYNMSMKMELPAKYKTLFDGVKAFPEMAKEILPIIEELVHFHNCICLLRRDLNLSRCGDCGRGFAAPSRVKVHARHCVIQKLENRFAPASITEHIGAAAPEETPATTRSETESKSIESERKAIVPDDNVNSSRKTRSRLASDPDYTPDALASQKHVKIKDETLSYDVMTDVVTDKRGGSTTPTGKRKRARKAKEDREFEKGTCWGVPSKTDACRITRVVEHNQFSHKIIPPYHLFRYSGEEFKSLSTVKKTEMDVQYFQQFLLENECVQVPMKDLPEDELVKHLSTFFSGVKKRKDGEDYEPTTLWRMYASLKRHLTEVKYNFEGSQPITAALAPVTEVLKAVSRQLKKKGMGNLPNASHAISNTEVMKLYADKVAGRHSPKRQLHHVINIGSLLQESKSQSTVKKTERDVQYFQQFLLENECVQVPMKDLPEDELVRHLSTFFSGVKKRKDGEDYEPTTLWSMYASLKRHLTEVKYNFEGSQHITAALAPVTEVLKAVSRQLKKKGMGNLPNASHAISNKGQLHHVINIGSLLQESKSTVKKTERDVQYFQQFLLESECVQVPMKDLPEDELVRHLSTFFSGVKKRKDGEDYEPTTLWSMYASLKRHLTEVKYNFEGSQHITAALAPVTEVLKAVSRQLKKKGMGNLPNASHAISNTEVMKLYADKVAGRHSPMALNNAMVINLMFLGFRGCRELYNRMLGDLKIVSVDGKNELHIAKERVTKTLGEVPKVAPFGLPTLAATGNDDCPVKAFEELKKRRPAKFMHDDSPMFMRPLRPSSGDPKTPLVTGDTWYYDARAGINYISKMTKTMVGVADIDVTGRKITNTSCRKSMATTMIKKNYSTKSLMRQLKHTNPNSMLRYDAADTPAEQTTGDLFGQQPEQPCSSKDCAVTEQEQPGPPVSAHSHFGTKIFNIQF